MCRGVSRLQQLVKIILNEKHTDTATKACKSALQ